MSPPPPPPGVPDTGLICLAMVVWFLGLPVNPDDLRHRLGVTGGPLGVTDLLRAARMAGVRARAVTARADRLDRAPLPALAETRGGGFVILAQAGPDGVLVQDPLAGAPQALDRAALEALWTG